MNVVPAEAGNAPPQEAADFDQFFEEVATGEPEGFGAVEIPKQFESLRGTLDESVIQALAKAKPSSVVTLRGESGATVTEPLCWLVPDFKAACVRRLKEGGLIRGSVQDGKEAPFYFAFEAVGEGVAQGALPPEQRIMMLIAERLERLETAVQLGGSGQGLNGPNVNDLLAKLFEGMAARMVAEVTADPMEKLDKLTQFASRANDFTRSLGQLGQAQGVQKESFGSVLKEVKEMLPDAIEGFKAIKGGFGNGPKVVETTGTPVSKAAEADPFAA